MFLNNFESVPYFFLYLVNRPHDFSNELRERILRARNMKNQELRQLIAQAAFPNSDETNSKFLCEGGDHVTE